MTLTGEDLFVWLALRRVEYRRLTEVGGRYLDHGRPVSCFLPDVLDDLIQAGVLVLGDPDPRAGDMRRLAMTETGQARYARLCRREGIPR
ncbi:MAG: hypothetical protein ACRDTF_18090 [Pseudonocardiaceae bacterium]